MKIILTFLALTIVYQIVNSQSLERIVEPYKSWNILISDHPSTGNTYRTINVSFKGDTIIDQVHYKKIIAEHDCPRFIREDSTGHVYALNHIDDGEYILYNFNANIGDTIFLRDFIYNESFAIIDSIDTTFIAGKYRKRLWNSIYSTVYSGNLIDCWIEGIGSHFGVVFSGNYNIFINTDLLCYYEDTTMKYSTEMHNYFGCYFSNVGINDYTKNNENIFILNDLNNNSIQIICKNCHYDNILTIKNINGNIIYKENLNEINNISTIYYPKGIYFYHIYDKKLNNYKSGKFIVL